MLIGLGIGIPFTKYQVRSGDAPDPHPGDNLLLETGFLLLLENGTDTILLEP